MDARTVLDVWTDDHRHHQVNCNVGVAVEHLKGHVMMVQAQDGSRHVWNFSHVLNYKLTEKPATPAEGS